MKEIENSNKTTQSHVSGRGKWLVGGGLAAAFTAALCCLGPLVFAGLGLGAFAAAGFFHEMRPFLLGLAFLFVAGAWFQDWRKRKRASRESAEIGVACETGCHRRSRAGLVLVTVAALLLGASPYILEGWLAQTAGDRGINAAVIETGNEASHLAVWEAELEGLYCPSCTPGLQRAFENTEGVKAAKVTYRPQMAIVHYDPEHVNGEKFPEMVEEFGYGVKE